MKNITKINMFSAVQQSKITVKTYLSKEIIPLQKKDPILDIIRRNKNNNSSSNQSSLAMMLLTSWDILSQLPQLPCPKESLLDNINMNKNQFIQKIQKKCSRDIRWPRDQWQENQWETSPTPISDYKGKVFLITQVDSKATKTTS